MKRALCVLGIILLAWVVASWINTVSVNTVRDASAASWNVFNIMFA